LKGCADVSDLTEKKAPGDKPQERLSQTSIEMVMLTTEDNPKRRFGTGVGIMAVAEYLPPEIRANDWWRTDVVSKWSQPQRLETGVIDHGCEASMGLATRVTRLLKANRGDPFWGIGARHVMPEDMTAADMECRAAAAALNKAGLRADDVDVLICGSAVPDQLVSNNACIVHERLGLKRSCFSCSIDVACNPFLMGLDIGSRMIREGPASVALVVQSSAVSRLLDYSKPASAWWGDAATAAVMGRARPGKGILAMAHRTDGSLHGGVVAGVPGRRWYDDGRVVLHSLDGATGVRLFVALFETGRELANAVLDEAGYDAEEVQYLAVHQALSWVPGLAREVFGVHRAKTSNTFCWSGNVFGSSLPLSLLAGQREGRLQDNDLVLMVGMGAGGTFSSTLLRWGC
jgi:3-oxoacyl-[acyl-carrier-protein] synthase-3